MVRCLRCACLCEEAHAYCFACGGELLDSARATPQDTLVGRELPGGYRITCLIGVGGMGRVYCAEQIALGRLVAVKVVHPEFADDELAAARFVNEARTASRLNHPNSVAIFDFGMTQDGLPYIVMEYLKGQDLGRLAHARTALPLRRIVDILRQTLAALDEAHALGIVHRDLKPDNIVLEPLRSGLDMVKVVDFGLAKVVRGDIPSPPRFVSLPGLVCGTPEYMSPEQARGLALDGRSDLYALGIVLYELLTGCLPFAGDGPAGTLMLHLTELAIDPRTIAPERAIPAAFAEVAMHAIAKSPEDRFQTARAFSEALENALFDSEGGHGVASAPPTPIRCERCGGTSAVSQKFCGGCGASMAWTERDAYGPTVPPPASGSGDTHTRATSPAHEAVVASRRSALPLLSREDAIRWFEARREDSAVLPAAAHLVGEAGMGKTRLLDSMAARWSSRGDLVVTVGTDPSWAKVGDHAVRQAVRALGGLADGPSGVNEWSHASSQAAQGLDEIFGTPGRSRRPPAERRLVVAEALRWSLERAAERAGRARVVLAVDDLDFIDGTSRNAFGDLLAEPPPVPALIVVTYTTGTRPVGDPVAGEVWRLQPLPYESFAHEFLTRTLVPHVALSPLHVEQLLAWAGECNEPPPERLVEIIAARAERLPRDARHALQAMAVWGDAVGRDLLQELLPATVEVESALEALHRAGIARAVDGGFQIAHPLVRSVVFSTTPAGRKRELFARAAELCPDAPLEVRARQAVHAGSALEALALLDALSAERAANADLAGSVSALRQALDVARRELHRGELDDPTDAVLVFARKLAEALGASQRWSDAEGILNEALGTAAPASGHRAHLLGALARVANARAHPREARRYLDEAMRVARQSDARELLPILEQLDKSIAVA
jgi:serine/threonine protein kinase